MSKRENYETKTERLLIPIAGKYGVEIYDVEYVKEGGEWYLRAYIDKPEGVAILDCENVSRELSDALDAEDFIPDAYILEVSSPGLGRTLKKDRHLEKSLGAEVEIRTYKSVDGRKEFTGVLHAYDGDTITIEEPRPDTGETDADKAAEPGTERVLNRKEIALIRLTFDF